MRKTFPLAVYSRLPRRIDIRTSTLKNPIPSLLEPLFPKSRKLPLTILLSSTPSFPSINPQILPHPLSLSLSLSLKNPSSSLSLSSTMHAKTDSEVTSLAPSSPPRCQIYYVMSPSHADAEKISLGGSTTPGVTSPIHHHQHHRYASSPIHHSRESSTTRFSAPLKQNGNSWRRLADFRHQVPAGDDIDDDEDEDRRLGVRCYLILFVLGFIFLFSMFSLILWGASKAYKPEVIVKSVVFEFYNVQAGMDLTGVPTKMLSINSTVRMKFRNKATFFGVHVTSTPLELYYSDLMVASGQMKEFYEPRKTGRMISVSIVGTQVPLYGGGSNLNSGANGIAPAVVPLDLAFVVRARAHVLGQLVKSKFYRRIHCSLVLREKRLGKRIVNLGKACEYRD